MPERCVLRRRRCGAGAPLLSSQRALDLMTTNGGRKCCRACSKKTALMAQCWCDKSMAQSSASSGHFRGASPSTHVWCMLMPEHQVLHVSPTLRALPAAAAGAVLVASYAAFVLLLPNVVLVASYAAFVLLLYADLTRCEAQPLFLQPLFFCFMARPQHHGLRGPRHRCQAGRVGARGGGAGGEPRLCAWGWYKCIMLVVLETLVGGRGGGGSFLSFWGVAEGGMQTQDELGVGMLTQDELSSKNADAAISPASSHPLLFCPYPFLPCTCKAAGAVHFASAPTRLFHAAPFLLLTCAAKQHADMLASEMDEDQLTEEQKEDLKRIRLRKKQIVAEHSITLRFVMLAYNYPVLCFVTLADCGRALHHPALHRGRAPHQEGYCRPSGGAASQGGLREETDHLKHEGV
eukprot:1157637-Pelagomonas_calceolata.AAC.4